jgi:hypothetical protein
LAKCRITENHARLVERYPVKQIEELGSELQSGLLDPPKIQYFCAMNRSCLGHSFAEQTKFGWVRSLMTVT